MPNLHESLLSQADSDKNLSVLNSFTLSPNVLDFIEKYSDENKITLQNLLEAERLELQVILNSVSAKEFDDAKRDQLLEQLKVWKGKLRHAVYGVGEHVVLHNSQIIGMASGIHASGKIPLSQWGTDLDITQCLADNITNPKNIAAPGIYVLAPSVLTAQADSAEAEASLQKELEFALNAISSNLVTDQVKLLVPVNCGNSHWRLAIIQIKDMAIESACLWDSLSDPENQLTSSPAYLTLQKAVAQAAKKPAIPTSTHAQGIQTNSSTCMDFVIQEIYRLKGVNNKITAAASAAELRLAVVRQIVLNQPDLGPAVAEKLHIDGTTISSNLSLVEKNKFLQNLAQRKKSQIQFDGFFAKELQKLYNQNPRSCDTDTTAEKKLQQAAFTSAYREFLANSTDEAETTTDNTSPSSPRRM